MSSDQQKLKKEIADDPLGRGYSTMDDDQVVASMTNEDIGIPRGSMSGNEIGGEIDEGGLV